MLLFVHRIDDGYSAASKRFAHAAATPDEALKRALFEAYNYGITDITVRSCVGVTVDKSLQKLFSSFQILPSSERDSDVVAETVQREIRIDRQLANQRQTEKLLTPAKSRNPQLEEFGRIPLELKQDAIDRLPPCERLIVSSYDSKRGSGGWLFRHEDLRPIASAGNRSLVSGFTGVAAQINQKLKEMEAGPEMWRYFARAGTPGCFQGSAEESLALLAEIEQTLAAFDSHRAPEVLSQIADPVWRKNFAEQFPHKENALAELKRLLKKRRPRTVKPGYSRFHYVADYHHGECPSCLVEIGKVPAHEGFCPKCGADLDPSTFFESWAISGCVSIPAEIEKTETQLRQLKASLATAEAGKIREINQQIKAGNEDLRFWKKVASDAEHHPQKMIAKYQNDLIRISEDEASFNDRVAMIKERIFRMDPACENSILRRRQERLNAMEARKSDEANQLRRRAYQGIGFWQDVQRSFLKQEKTLTSEFTRKLNTRSLMPYADGTPAGSKKLMAAIASGTQAHYRVLFDRHATEKVAHWIRSHKFDANESLAPFVHYITGMSPASSKLIMKVCREAIRDYSAMDIQKKAKRNIELDLLIWALTDPHISCDGLRINGDSPWHVQPAFLPKIYAWLGGKVRGKFVEAILLPKEITVSNKQSGKPITWEVKTMLSRLLKGRDRLIRALNDNGVHF